MKLLKILGIYRHPKFSNNAIEADRKILQDSIQLLASRFGLAISVETLEESEVPASHGSFDLILTMAQSEETLHALEQNFGDSLIWNSPASIRNCYRKNMSRILISKNVGYVPFSLVSTESTASLLLEAGQSYWLKRSDFHAISDEDVTLAEGPEEVLEKLKLFRKRGIKEVIIQKHIHGDIYKFYGVNGEFFRAIKVRSLISESVEPNFELLRKNAAISADALGLNIYGGDCIVDSDGNLHLIDMNDWPSFRICREDAAKAISSLAAKQLDKAPTLTNPIASVSASHA